MKKMNERVSIIDEQLRIAEPDVTQYELEK